MLYLWLSAELWGPPPFVNTLAYSNAAYWHDLKFYLSEHCLCSSGYPETPYIDQAGLKLTRDPPASECWDVPF